jgi:hypothetical protein
MLPITHHARSAEHATDAGVVTRPQPVGTSRPFSDGAFYFRCKEIPGELKIER